MKGIEYIVCTMGTVQENDKDAIRAGEKIETIKLDHMVAPGMSVTVKGRKRRVRCVDLLRNGYRRIIVE